jgi:hypothetical protein
MVGESSRCRRLRLALSSDEILLGHFDETPENVEQAGRVGEWMDKRDPLFQCSDGVLAGRGASKVRLLGRARRCRSGGDRPLELGQNIKATACLRSRLY